MKMLLCSRRTFYNIWLWSGCGPVFLITAGSYPWNGKGMHYWLSPRQDRDSLGLAWTHRRILPTSEKTLANWSLSEQLGLTLSLPALMLSKDRSRHRLQARMVSEDLLHADTKERAASDLTGPVYHYNPSGTNAIQGGLPTKLRWVSSLAGRTWDKPESVESQDPYPCHHRAKGLSPD